jgi:transposase
MKFNAQGSAGEAAAHVEADLRAAARRARLFRWHHHREGLRARRWQRLREVFVPLRHHPEHAQADFGEAVAAMGGVEQKIHFFAMDLPHSDAGFVQA